jgi:hypothetical protein
VPFTDVARSLDEQVLHAQALVSEGRLIAAAVVVAQLPSDVDRAHVSAVLTELEREHAHNAVVALELIRGIYSQPQPRLRLVADRGAGRSLT